MRGQVRRPTPSAGKVKVSLAPLECNAICHSITVVGMDKTLGAQGVSNYPWAKNTSGRISPTAVQQLKCIETIAENSGIDVDKNPAEARQNDKSVEKARYFVTTVITI